MMRMASVCSGIGGAELAFRGIAEHAFAAEIDPFARAVLAQRFPHLVVHNDFTEIIADGPVDALVGGTPCQSFSIAGLRRGMADERGNLALEFLRLADRLRACWVLWENVPGVLSSSGGRDFGAFLGGLGELGYGFAYRVLDAQYFGLAQRRKRVFVVGYLGDWRRAAAVLFEPASLRGNPPPSRTAREGIAGTLEAGANRTGGDRPPGTSVDTADTLVANPLKSQKNGGSCRPAVATASSVRRLTPRECESLQGFPPDWTAITHRGKPAADGPRYRALGNAFAINCVRWIARRLVAEDGRRED